MIDLSKILSTSHKTTIAAFAAAVLNLIANGVSVRQAIFSASLIALGRMAKDFDKTGPSKIEEVKDDIQDKLKEIKKIDKIKP